MSVAADRTVRRLRLRGPGEAELRRAATRLEDALRVATLHDPAGRVVVVRRVELPPLEPGASSQSLALALERAMGDALAGGVHGNEPGAVTAPVVWFADGLEAHVVAARRLLSGVPLDAWYWPLAVPALAGPGPSLRALALSVARMEVAPVALPAWVAAVARAAGVAGLSRLRAALGPADAAFLAAAAGLEGWEVAAASPSPGPGVAHSLDGESGAEVVAVVAALCARGGEGTVAAEWTARPGSVRVGEPGAGEAGPLPRSSEGPRPEARSRARDRQGGGEGLREAARTRGAGLLFLLPVLARLGYAEWSEDHPDWDRWLVAGRTLRAVADRLEVAADDPVRRALPVLTEEPGEAPLRWRAPASFRPLRRRGGTIRRERGDMRYRWDRSGALLLGFTPREGGGDVPGRGESEARAEAVAGAWAVAARRWLRQRAGLGVPGLVVRSGHVTVSSTHVDVTLPLAAADVRVRRAGLDIDPGWVPWFRRVVRFHYADGPPEGSDEGG